MIRDMISLRIVIEELKEFKLGYRHSYTVIESNFRNIMKLNDNKIYKTKNIKYSSHYSNVINNY